MGGIIQVMQVSCISKSKDNACAMKTTFDIYGNPTASTPLERKGKINVLFWILKEKWLFM